MSTTVYAISMLVFESDFAKREKGSVSRNARGYEDRNTKNNKEVSELPRGSPSPKGQTQSINSL